MYQPQILQKHLWEEYVQLCTIVFLAQVILLCVQMDRHRWDLANKLAINVLQDSHVKLELLKHVQFTKFVNQIQVQFIHMLEHVQVDFI